MSRTLIVGTGISAAAYANTNPRGPDESRNAVGGAHLWQPSRTDGSHHMGQSPQLLSGNVLSDPTRRSPAPNGQFMAAADFAKRTDAALRDSVDSVTPREVTNIKRGGDQLKQFEVKFRASNQAEIFDRVILALGPGENRMIKLTKEGPDLDVSAFAGHVMTGDDFMKPDWSPPKTMLSTKHVAIYGGSATASWIAETAAARGMTIGVWFTRVGEGNDAWDAEKRFAPAFPAGDRNTKVKKDTEKVRKVLKLTDVDLISAEQKKFLALTVEVEGGKSVLLVPDLLVYALGYEHTSTTGVGRILDPALRNELVPYYDRNLMISDKQCLLAIGTSDGNLMMVGSGMVSSGGIDRDKLTKDLGTYTDIAITLPPASRPPEGIAMVLSGIEALNQFVPAKPIGQVQTLGMNKETKQPFQDNTRFAWDINFNTCNRTQLALYLAQTSDLPPFAANVAVELVMRLRTDASRVFGEMDQDKVDRICAFCLELANTLQRNNGTMTWINEKIPGEKTEFTVKRAYFHELVAAHLIDKKLLNLML